ncbi:Hypothetical protein Tpal_2254 [Trichococcus palustris]|uniref:Uncharacterized protein n=1 Tax=Trichococcus palustris TaxID=140314 RepID=A0A143YVR5_9LACT|nr:hypothetical protein [Trichococcus palustris]CZQ98355.1 Hypothetical protein Tpal_2254 [Trichococcus palustris]SFK94989.1 hypothetical protein SAMN04488076_11066 [Trichococcus palustris]
MKKREFVFNLSLFAGCLLFALSMFNNSVWIIAAALIASSIALKVYRQDNPKMNKNYKELVVEKSMRKKI